MKSSLDYLLHSGHDPDGFRGDCVAQDENPIEDVEESGAVSEVRFANENYNAVACTPNHTFRQHVQHSAETSPKFTVANPQAAIF